MLELLVVIVIIGILAAILLPAMGEPAVLMLDIYLDRPGPDGKALAQQLRTRSALLAQAFWRRSTC